MSKIHLKAKTAFTLIELLVVIAIIAILAAILFPVFARARENARRTSCLSNLKQMGLAAVQYTQDYDGFYPFAYSNGMGGPPPGGQWSGDTWFWQHALYAYHKSYQAMSCPNGDPLYDTKPWRGHYGSNWIVCPAPPSGTAAPANIQESEFGATSKTYLFMDAGEYRIPINSSNGGIVGPKTRNYLPGSGPGTVIDLPPLQSSATDFNKSDFSSDGRHFDGVNIAFADGHVKWLKSTIVFAEAKKGCDSSGVNPRPNNASAFNVINPG